MNEELINEVLSRLDAVGAELSKGAAFGYEVLVRQQVIEGIVGLLLAVIFAAVFVVAIRFGRGSYKSFVANKLGNRKPNYFDMAYDMTDWTGPIGVPLGIASLAFGILSLVNLVGGLQKLLNPHYYAIYEILERVPG